MPEIARRDFLKLVGTSAGAAAAAGCSDHVTNLIPYVVQPEEITPGLPVYYASTCRECPAGCGIHVKTREGRPVLIEGNPDHPVNRGALCARGQASIGRTYHPERFKGPMLRNGDGELEPISWDDAIARLASEVGKNARSTHFLGSHPGETLSRLMDELVGAMGASRTVMETFADESLREAARQVFGEAALPVFDLSDADLVIDFGNELLDTGLSPTEHQRQLADARDPDKHEHGGARLVYVGSRLSLTASSADEWLPAVPGTEGMLALALAQVAMSAGGDTSLATAVGSVDVNSVAQSSGVPADTIERIGRAIAKGKRVVALPPGPAVKSRRAIGATAAVLVLNAVAGALGRGMTLSSAGDRGRPNYRDVLALVKQMQDGAASVLFVHGANPVYALPKAAGFAEALAKVGFVVSTASAPDDTTAHAHLILPDHTPLESWGDVSPRDGVRDLVQPSIRPLYDTRSLGDVLLATARAIGGSAAAAAPEGDFQAVLASAWADTDFRKAQADGGVFTQAPAVTATPTGAPIDASLPKLSGEGDYTLVAFPHSFLYDGSGADLPWLQEIPDPVTSVAWQSWAEISLTTADKLGVELGDVIAIETSAGSIEVPVYPRGGIRDDVVAVPIGQGHEHGYWASKTCDGIPGEARGVNVIDVLSAAVDESGGRAWLTERASLTNTGRSRRLPMLQWSDNKRQRQLGEVIALAELEGEHHGNGAGDHHGNGAGDDHGGHGGGHGDHHEIHEPYDAADDARDGIEYRWGMTVDLDRCNGCSACIQACYIENNVPVVGELETLRVRQMPWIRLDRWVGEGEQDLPYGRVHPQANGEKLGETDVRNSPMFCQQCGSAPCEPVCPVIATYTNDEGLNAMVYNRCIGTRYCANNCPYKVRRFNYFDNQITKIPEPMHLMLNPDVTVRGQGVMEKCTFCVQRIQAARQTAKDEGRMIEDSEVKTACQRACGAGAIDFGNLRASGTPFRKKFDDPKRGYHALHVLNTRPAVTYLKKVQRGKVEA